MIRTEALLAAAIVGVATCPGRAQPVDCHALTSTRIPFQLTYEIQRRIGPAKEPVRSYQIFQVHREASGASVNDVASMMEPAYRSLGGSAPSKNAKSITQNTLPMETQDADRTVFVYSGVDPRTFGPRTGNVTYFQTIRSMKTNKEYTLQSTREVIGESSVTLSGCTFKTVTTRSRSLGANDATAETISELSPELGLSLQYKQDIASMGYVTHTDTKAIDLTTRFDPMR